MTEKAPVPAGAKKPQDRKPKAETGDSRHITVRGAEFTVPHDALDDFELLDDLTMLQDKEDGTRLPSILRRIVGTDEQHKKALDLIRDPDTGRVTTGAAGDFIGEFIEALDPNS